MYYFAQLITLAPYLTCTEIKLGFMLFIVLLLGLPALSVMFIAQTAFRVCPFAHVHFM